MNRNYLGTGRSELLSEILRIIFVENGENWNRVNLNIEEVLGNVIHFYEHNASEGNVSIFKLLCDVILLENLNKSEKYQLWLSTLPKMLTKNAISKEVLDEFSLISRRNCRLFQMALLENLSSVLSEYYYY